MPCRRPPSQSPRHPRQAHLRPSSLDCALRQLQLFPTCILTHRADRLPQAGILGFCTRLSPGTPVHAVRPWTRMSKLCCLACFLLWAREQVVCTFSHMHAGLSTCVSFTRASSRAAFILGSLAMRSGRRVPSKPSCSSTHRTSCRRTSIHLALLSKLT